MGEECGVVACVLKDKSVKLSAVVYNLLSELQHRGQTSSGIAMYSADGCKLLRSRCCVGKVANLFRSWDRSYFDRMLADFDGDVGIGHVRYATSNVSDDVGLLIEGAQPFYRRHGRPWKRFAVAFNGHLTNYESLRNNLIRKGYVLDSDVDTEVLMHLISVSLKNNWDGSPEGVFDVFREVTGKLDGSFSLVFNNGVGDLVIVRDKMGFRPLVIGENDDMICVASESKALMKVGISEFRDVRPGEVVLVRGGKIYSDVLSEGCGCAHCHFEYVYFSDACSVNDGILVNDVRVRLGRILGREEKLRSDFNCDDWVVVPVPSTSNPIAVAYSEETKVPLSLALIKSDVGRGFINSGSMRKAIMDSKYNVVPNSVVGKKVLLIDDSIVRGETSARVIKLLREAGAAEVHFRVAEMPIKFPCCYGVDFPSFEELIAGGFEGSGGGLGGYDSTDSVKSDSGESNIEDFVCGKIGADSMGYVSFEGLKEALGGDGEKFCFACLDGKYPTGAGAEFFKRKL